MTNFTNIDYLLAGSPIQQRVHAVITQHQLLEKLAPFSPLLAGTFPLGIEVPGSDLDILCHVTDPGFFHQSIIAAFGHEKDFSIRTRNGRVIANFYLKEFPIELFGENAPTTEQWGYRHLIAEEKILLEQGPAFKAQIIALKQAGVKTEPAFAQLLGLTGDPYLTLLQY